MRSLLRAAKRATGRHSAVFYQQLATPLTPPAAAGLASRHGGAAQTRSALAHVVACAADTDEATRKFACFALGNAAFHSNALYDALLECGAVAPLVAALRDADDKTRCNAAGALGNLARNGGALCEELARCCAVAALLRCAHRDPVEAVRRIAFFSLGTLAAWRVPRDYLTREPLAAKLDAALRDALASRDATARKYAQRLKTKLQSPPADDSRS